jgi:hypothetical protein
MRRLCLHICPESGPFAYLRLHFSVELPSNYVSFFFATSPLALVAEATITSFLSNKSITCLEYLTGISRP